MSEMKIFGVALFYFHSWTKNKSYPPLWEKSDKSVYLKEQ